MSDVIADSAHWEACEDCVYSDEGVHCWREDFALGPFDQIICESHKTEADAQERQEELWADADRDERPDAS